MENPDGVMMLINRGLMPKPLDELCKELLTQGTPSDRARRIVHDAVNLTEGQGAINLMVAHIVDKLLERDAELTAATEEESGNGETPAGDDTTAEVSTEQMETPAGEALTPGPDSPPASLPQDPPAVEPAAPPAAPRSKRKTPLKTAAKTKRSKRKAPAKTG